MSTATISDVTNLGFTKDDFGSPSDWDTDPGYIQTILDDKALIVTAEVGSTIYASPTALQAVYIKEAERYLAAAELQRRLENFKPAQVTVGRVADAPPTISSRFLRTAMEYEDLAYQNLAKITGNTQFGGVGQTVQQSGRLTTVDV